MIYKGKKVKIELKYFEEYINEKGYWIYPEYVYNYFKARRWKGIKGRKIKSIEWMVDFMQNKLYNKQPLPPVKLSKKLKKTKKKDKHPWIDYKDQLKDPRWFEFRKKVFNIRGYKCEKCGSTFNLQVHHPKYSDDKRYAWEYDVKDVIVLCRACHIKEHNLEPSQAS